MRAELARALAGAFLCDGPWDEAALVARGRLVTGRRPAWLTPLVREVLEIYHRAPADRPREFAAVVSTRPAAARARRVRPRSRPVAPTRMVSNPYRVPALDDVDALCDLLGLGHGELLWFSDPKRWSRRAEQPALQHYRVTTKVAASGSTRVLEAPKPRLKALQRLLLARVLDRVAPHEAAHGFRRGRSVASYAAPHAGRAVVVRLDLEGFFASVTVGRVYGILRTAGYPEPVAHALAGLTTTVLPLAAWRIVPRPTDAALLPAHWRLGRSLALPHLPQGAPTSPALANLAARHLDVRLTALVGSWGGRYTRYADDLALSSPHGWGARTSRLVDAVRDVVREQGFRLNERKSAVLPASGRQSLGGLVVNSRPRPARADVDRLRAELHNCAVHGPSSQNHTGHDDYRAHLVGRVGWVAQHDSVRGPRLAASLARIDWTR